MYKNKIKVKSVLPGNNERVRLCFVLPTFNREKTIGSALELLSSQIQHSKYKKFLSVLISENHSTDRSAEIAGNFAFKHDFIKIITPEHHLPSGEHNLFFALKHVTTDFVWSFADDDLLLPGAIDWIYEHVLESKADFILINSQYQDSDGNILRDRILEMTQDVIYFDSFADVFSEIGPLTLLASFSSAFYRPEKIVELDLDDFLNPCPIYAHVFAYLEAFSSSRVEILSVPLVVLRRTTATAHWEHVAERFGWYMYYPWTGSLAIHILRAQSRNMITVKQYGCALNSNENGRYGLIANLLTQFILQLLRALETGDPREIPPSSDFANIRTVVQVVPYVTVDTLDFLLWGEKYFEEICTLLASQHIKLQNNSNRLTNAIHNLDAPGYTALWVAKIHEKLIERLHSIKESYINFGTTSSESSPFLYLKGHRFVIFQLATRFILMSRTLYQEDWMVMNPNFLDPIDQPPDWYIFSSFEQALKYYFTLENASNAAETKSDDRVILNIAKTQPWDTLVDIIEIGDVASFLEAVSHNPTLDEVRQVIGTILGHTDSKNEIDLFSIEPARGNFINPLWYRETYLQRTKFMEREIIQQSPLVHYVMLGARKGWSLSPFFDEFFFKNARKSISEVSSSKSLSERICLATYCSVGGEDDISAFFSVHYYLEQCNQKGIMVSGLPIVHFLTTGINQKLSPHPNWNEISYMSVNPDVRLTSNGAPYYGWLHWCTNGRFEKRESSFTRRGQ
jgi:glycosyltransferase involved in cell wall biosynthesis